MKAAYFQCFAGISGDMITGALLDAGMDFHLLERELEKLKISGYTISKEQVTKNGISGIKFAVKVKEKQPSRNLADIENIYKSSSLDDSIKKKSLEIFWLLAEAESTVHNEPLDKIHFHEVGAVDSIIDITSACISLEKLGIEKVFSSPVHIGTGFVDTMHGKLPVPAPATVELLKGIPVYSTGIKSELTTPTGAAIISALADEFTDIPLMKIFSTGYGAGTRELPIPNLLRLITGELIEEEYEADSVTVLETNIDDMNPEFYDYVIDRLFKEGALDVYLQPVIMKKSRPGNILTVLTNPRDVDRLTDIIFRETTTSGIRISSVSRKKLSRDTGTVMTPYGEIMVKIHYNNGNIITISPEFDSCRAIAEEKNVPVKEVYSSAKTIADNKFMKH